MSNLARHPHFDVHLSAHGLTSRFTDIAPTGVEVALSGHIALVGAAPLARSAGMGGELPI